MKMSANDSLTRIVLEDIKTSANFKKRKIISWMIDTFGYRPAGWLAELLERIDDQLNETTLYETAGRAIQSFSDGLVVNNQGAIPVYGPLLVVANHPGLADILGVVASLKREDVKIVAQQKGFMRVLRNINRHILTIEPDSTFKLNVIHEVIHALKDGMAVIIFPSGSLEPDPAIVPGAVESLQGWSDSIGVFLNKVPETQLLPLLVSNVLTEKAWNSRFAKLGRNQKRRQQFASVVQFIAQRFSKEPHWKKAMRIDVGILKVPAQIDPSLDSHKSSVIVKKEMAELLQSVYPWQST